MAVKRVPSVKEMPPVTLTRAFKTGTQVLEVCDIREKKKSEKAGLFKQSELGMYSIVYCNSCSTLSHKTTKCSLQIVREGGS